MSLYCPSLKAVGLLQRLDLHGNDLDHEGAQQLVNGKWPLLQWVDLPDNRLFRNQEGPHAFSDLLQGMNSRWPGIRVHLDPPDVVLAL